MKDFFSNIWTQYGTIILSMIPAITALIKLAGVFKQSKIFDKNIHRLENKVNDDIKRTDDLKNAILTILENEKTDWDNFISLTFNKRQKAFIKAKIEKLNNLEDSVKKLYVEEIKIETKKVKVKKKK